MKINLAQIRQEKQLTTRQLAKLSGVSHAQITQIENGNSNPTISTMCKLAKALNVKITELFICD